MACHDCSELFIRFGVPVKCGRCEREGAVMTGYATAGTMTCRHCEWLSACGVRTMCLECDIRAKQRACLDADGAVTRIDATTFAITRNSETDYVGFCARHQAVTGPEVTSRRDVQPCELCVAEQTAQRRRDRYMALVRAAGLCVLLALSSTARAEGYIIPETATAGPLTLGAVSPAPQPMRWGTSKKLIAFAVIGQVLDLISTDVVLARGGVELNPLMKRREVRYGVKGLFILGTFGLSALPKGQADGFAKTVGWTGLIPGIANTVQAVAK